LDNNKSPKIINYNYKLPLKNIKVLKVKQHKN
jgi:hypothetical protein